MISLVELMEELKVSPDAIKKALTAYSKNGGKGKIEIEETKENYMIYAL